MSAAQTTEQPDFDPSQYPDPLKEIEGKFLAPSKSSLKKLCKSIADVTQNHSPELYTSRGYTTFLEKNYLTKAYKHSPSPPNLLTLSMNPVMKSEPVSWYWVHLNKDGKVEENDTTARTRVSLAKGNLLKTFEHCVKGPEQGYDIAFVSNRDEYEYENENPIFSPEFIIDEHGNELANAYFKKPTYLGFATDVDRNMIGLIVAHNGKRSLVELAFDQIKYIAPRDPETSKNGKHKTIEMAQEYQVEIEYKHPVDENYKQTELAKKLELDHITSDEVKEVIKIAEQFVLSKAQNLNINLRGEMKSKGERGTELLNESPLAKPIPHKSLTTERVMDMYEAPLHT